MIRHPCPCCRPPLDRSSTQLTVEAKPPHPCVVKCKAFFKGLYRVLSSSLGLFVILFGYTFAGAALFHAIEGPEEEERLRLAALEDPLNDTVELAWNVTSMGLNETDFKLVLRERLELALGQGNRTEVTPIWDFWGAMLFCCTVYTTIGGWLGHIAF